MPRRTNLNKADRKPTYTALVLAALVAADDFLSLVHLRVAVPTANTNRLTAALHHLAKRKAIDSVVGGDGVLWWFATPSEDNRTRVVPERVEEPKGNRTRKARTVPVKKGP